jgi:pyruvate/2-oxoglutarate dehydrogenase complex dihydrolipoamide acyltransferase (E2) component
MLHLQQIRAAVTKEPAKKESVAADIPLSPAVRRIIFEHRLHLQQIRGELERRFQCS